MGIHGWVCGPKIYKFNNITFEFSYAAGPWPLKKNGEPKKRAGKKFYELFEEFEKLPKEEKRKYRISGGCIRF